MNTAILVREDVLEQAANTLQLEVNSSCSKKAYYFSVKNFSSWLYSQELDITQVTYDDMLCYRQYLLSTYSKNTATQRFMIARRLLDVAVKKKLIAENPAKDVKNSIRLDDTASHVALSKKEAKRLLAAVDTTTTKGKRDYAILLLLIYGGLRRSELVQATLADIVTKQEHIVLVIQAGKGNKRRDIPLHPQTFRAIKTYLDAAGRLDDNPASPLFGRFYKGDTPTSLPVTDEAICSIVKTYAAAAHIKATPHDLRATFITLAIDTGSPLIQVQRLAGHSSPTTTERYYSRKQDLDSSPIYKIDLEG